MASALSGRAGDGTGGKRRSRRPLPRRLWALAGLMTLQGVSLGFFAGDVIADVARAGLDTHTAIEALATLALLCGLVWGGWEMWHILQRTRWAEGALKMASGAFADLLADRFRSWELTPSEADVALLILKGVEPAEIADLRGSAAGTVRAQLAGIYAKSGTTGRGQFVSLFIEALLDTPVIGPEQRPAGRRIGSGRGRS